MTEPESADERRSRNELARFLKLAGSVLDRYINEILLRVTERVRHNLVILWQSARGNLVRVIQNIQIGLSKTRRTAFAEVAMFGETLSAKIALLEFDIREGAVRRVLKRLNSMFSSLAKVYPMLHAVKELKDHAEATMDSLREPPEFITLEDLL